MSDKYYIRSVYDRLMNAKKYINCYSKQDKKDLKSIIKYVARFLDPTLKISRNDATKIMELPNSFLNMLIDVIFIDIGDQDTIGGKSKKTKNKSKNKYKLKNKGGETFSWKVGDCVRPIGMPTYYTITNEHDKDNWLMSAPSGGGHNISDIIPKTTEKSGSWEKVECESGSKNLRIKKLSKKKKIKRIK